MQTLASMIGKGKSSLDKVASTRPIDGGIIYSDVHIEGVSKTNFAIDFLNSCSSKDTPDVALRIYVDFDNKKIERKARIAGKWTPAFVSAPDFLFRRNEVFRIDVACGQTKYVITIDGRNEIFFNHVFQNLPLVDVVSIRGEDISVQHLEMKDATLPLGTVFPTQNFDRIADAKLMKAAIKDKEVDLEVVVGVLVNRSNEQRQAIKWQYNKEYKKDLETELDKLLSGDMSEVIVGLLDTPDVYDAKCLFKAMEGIGTDEKALIGILLSRNNKQLEAIKSAYKTLYKRSLIEDLDSETSGYFKQLLITFAHATRDESETVDLTRARHDAKVIFEAGEGQWGIDKSEINEVLENRSDAQLRATFKAYDEISELGIEGAIKDQASGDIQEGYLAVIKTACNPAKFFAERIYHSMQGLLKDDDQLIRVVISRSEVDLLRMKTEFYNLHSKRVHDYIKEECKDDFVQVLLGIVKTI
ncbi:annexin A13-like [Anneissia japonica]|uniref:annexin A13-like n=1 Tax=Anneissia japonica TaxID=1529436 RepID=UPI0014255A04|nr:annexin A13-like [Anneissia japonica]